MKYIQILILLSGLSLANASNLLPLSGSTRLDYLNGRYFALKENGIATSVDGRFWSDLAVPRNTHSGQLTFCNGLYLYHNGSIGWTSPDLVVFDSFTRPPEGQIGTDGRRFLRLNQGIWSSPDGRIWYKLDANTYQDFVHANGLTVAVGTQGVSISRGVGFEPLNDAPSQLRRVVAIPGLFLARDEYGKVSRSVDGIRWSHASSPNITTGYLTAAGNYFYTYDYQGVARSRDGLQWELLNDQVFTVGIASNGQETLILNRHISRIEADGTTAQLGVGNLYARRVQVFKDLLYVMGSSCYLTLNGRDWHEIPGLEGTTHWLALEDRVLAWSDSEIWNSGDGIQWQKVASPVQRIQSIVGGANGLLLYGFDDKQCYIGQSPDGLAWSLTTRDCATPAAWVWNGKRYLGTGPKLQTSSNGFDWDALDLNSDQLLEHQGVFLLQQNYELLTSTDGIRFKPTNSLGDAVVAGGFWRAERDYPDEEGLLTWLYSLDGISWTKLKLKGRPVAKWQDQLILLYENLTTQTMPAPPEHVSILPWIANTSDKELVLLVNTSDQAQEVTLTALVSEGASQTHHEQLAPNKLMASTPNQLFPGLHDYALSISSPSKAVQLAYRYSETPQEVPVRMPALTIDQLARHAAFGSVIKADNPTLVITDMSATVHQGIATMELRDLDGNFLARTEKSMAQAQPRTWPIAEMFPELVLPDTFTLTIDVYDQTFAAVLLSRNAAGQLSITQPNVRLGGNPR